MNNVDILLDEYRRVRRVEITKELFIYVLKLYPALLVCMSDGKLDDDEWDNIMKLARGLADEFEDHTPMNIDKDRMAQNFRTEFRYLLENTDRWSKKFLNALKSHIDDNRHEKEFVMESMYLFANTADGISMEEQQAINNLSDRLMLEH
jgi:hypothetical protein